jgi:hypothetical protein
MKSGLGCSCQLPGAAVEPPECPSTRAHALLHAHGCLCGPSSQELYAKCASSSVRVVDILVSLMRECLQFDPAARPTAVDIRGRLEALVHNPDLFGKGWHCPRQPEW